MCLYGEKQGHTSEWRTLGRERGNNMAPFGMSDWQLKTHIEGLPCGISGMGYEDCERCREGHECWAYVEMGLKYKGLSDFDEHGNLMKK